MMPPDVREGTFHRAHPPGPSPGNMGSKEAAGGPADVFGSLVFSL